MVLPLKRVRETKTKVMFFSGGSTAAFQNGQQVPELQESWLLLYARMAIALGVDPSDLDVTMPDGRHAEIFGAEDGLNWQVT